MHKGYIISNDKDESLIDKVRQGFRSLKQLFIGSGPVNERGTKSNTDNDEVLAEESEPAEEHHSSE